MSPCDKTAGKCPEKRIKISQDENKVAEDVNFKDEIQKLWSQGPGSMCYKQGFAQLNLCNVLPAACLNETCHVKDKMSRHNFPFIFWRSCLKTALNFFNVLYLPLGHRDYSYCFKALPAPH